MPSDDLSLHAVSMDYHRDGSADVEHMDPYFWSLPGHHRNQPFLHQWKRHHSISNGHLAHVVERWFHHPATLVNPRTENKDCKERPECEPEYFNVPVADVRTTDQNYYFDIEVPGVTDRSSISVHWTSPDTFVVEGETTRPRIRPQSPLARMESDGRSDPGYRPLVRCPFSEEGDTEVTKKTDDEIEGMPKKTTGSEVGPDLVQKEIFGLDPTQPWTGPDEYEPVIILDERMIGSYRRCFNLPTDAHVDIKGTEASLGAGILTIRVPRTRFHQPHKVVKIPIG